MSETNMQSSLPQTLLMNALGQAPSLNVKNNITAGPNPMSYWNHSPGAERPLIREEGPFPVQGNVSSIIADESTNMKYCGNITGTDTKLPNIGSSPNCSGSFVPDVFTPKDTCGENCYIKYPESFGDKDFGFPEKMAWQQKVTNAHQIHAYQNVRAPMPGQGPSVNPALGSYEWIPRVTPDQAANSSILNPEPVYEQVPNFLPYHRNLQAANFNTNM